MIRIVLLSLALLPLASAAQMYKWIDEKGRTVYSEQPPPDGKASTKLDIRSSPGSSAPADWKQKEMDARQSRITKEQKDQGQKDVEDQATISRRANCLESQRQLSVAQQPRPLFTVDEKGEKVYLDDKDRQREIDGWAANVKKYCE